MNRLILQEFSRLADNCDLAAGALTRINADYGDRSGGRRQQQGSEIFLENFNGLRLGALPQIRANFVLDGRKKKPLVCVSCSAFEERSELRLPVAYNLRSKTSDELVVIDVHRKSQNAFASTAPYRQHPV